MNHPHVVDSDMYKEADWLMGAAIDTTRNDKGEFVKVKKAE